MVGYRHGTGGVDDRGRRRRARSPRAVVGVAGRRCCLAYGARCGTGIRGATSERSHRGLDRPRIRRPGGAKACGGNDRDRGHAVGRVLRGSRLGGGRLSGAGARRMGGTAGCTGSVGGPPQWFPALERVRRSDRCCRAGGGRAGLRRCSGCLDTAAGCTRRLARRVDRSGCGRRLCRGVLRARSRFRLGRATPT
jgi:hypothetical protein